MIEIGHNGGPELSADDEKLVMLFVRFNINDILKTLLEIRSLEERGFYMTVLFVMYDRGGYLPNDDYAAARALAVDVRTYRRMKAIMLKAKRIKETEEGLTQNRVQKEIERYTTEAMRRREAALRREEQRRKERELHMRSAEDRGEFRPISAGSSGHFGEKSPDKNSEIGGDLFGKPNENNGGDSTAVVEADTTAVPQRDQEPKPKLERKKEKNPPSPPQGGKSDTGTRLASEWSLPDEWRDEMMGKFVIRLDELFKEANAFHDYWISKPGRAGKKLDWRATFRNWVRTKFPERSATAAAQSAQLWWQKPEKLALVSTEQWVGLIHKWANGTWPIEKLGPAPGSRYCVVPDSVIERLDLVRFYTSSGSLKPGAIPPWSGGSH